MPHPAHQRATRRKIDRHGHDVTLTNYEVASEDEYGERYQQTTDSPKTVQAIVDRTSKGIGYERDARSADTKSARLFHVKDTVTGITDGGGDGASTITDDGTDYVVMEKDDLQNGSYRLLCWRED